MHEKATKIGPKICSFENDAYAVSGMMLGTCCSCLIHAHLSSLVTSSKIGEYHKPKHKKLTSVRQSVTNWLTRGVEFATWEACR